MEPPVSDPREPGVRFAATATALPPDDPPGVRSRSHGFLVGPKALFSVDGARLLERVLEREREKRVESGIVRLDRRDAGACHLLGRDFTGGNGPSDVPNGSRKPGAHSSTKPGTANPSCAVRGDSASASA